MDDGLLGMFVMIGRQRRSFVSMCLREAIFPMADNVFGEQEGRKIFTFQSRFNQKIVHGA